MLLLLLVQLLLMAQLGVTIISSMEQLVMLVIILPSLLLELLDGKLLPFPWTFALIVFQLTVSVSVSLTLQLMVMISSALEQVVLGTSKSVIFSPTQSELVSGPSMAPTQL